MNDLINSLEEEIKLSEDSREGENDKNKDLFQGITISRKEAKIFVELLKQSELGNSI